MTFWFWGALIRVPEERLMYELPVKEPDGKRQTPIINFVNLREISVDLRERN